MPPSTWMQDLATATAPSKQVTSATSAAYAHCSSLCRAPARADRATSQAAAVTASAGLEHLGAEVLDRLEGADLLAELLAHLGVVDRRLQAPARDAGGLGGGQGDGRTPDQRRAARPAPDRHRAVPPGQVDAQRRGRAGSAATSPSAPSTCVAPARSPASAQGTRGPGRPRRRRRSRLHGATRAATAVDSSGPGTSSCAHASSATAWSRTEPPPPPYDSGSPIVATPISTQAFQESANVASGVPLGVPGRLAPAQRRRPLAQAARELDVLLGDPDRHAAPLC